MTDASEPPAQPGLVSLRMEAERGRTQAIIQLVTAGCWLALGIANTLFRSPDTPFYFVYPVLTVVVVVGFTVSGVIQLRARRRRITAFEAEHGVGAGVQPWVGK
jgi:FtsH-binding integral membrane protein